MITLIENITNKLDFELHSTLLFHLDVELFDYLIKNDLSWRKYRVYDIELSIELNNELKI